VVGVLAGLAAAIYIVNLATKIWAASQAALNAVMALNPIGLIVIAVAALIAIVVLIATKTTWFQQLWGAAWGAIHGAVMAVWNWIKSNWPLILAIITGPIGLAVLAITKNWDTIKSGFTTVKDWISQRVNDIVGFFTGLGGRIASAASGAFDGLKTAAMAPFRAIAEMWNDTVGSISFKTPSWVPGFGGKGFSVPKINIPALAAGGIVTSPTLAMIGEGRYPEAVVPLKPGMFGGGGQMIQVTMILDGQVIGRSVERLSHQNQITIAATSVR